MTGWITFIGEGRSGHTILSAILDSHPNVRIGEEQKCITKWKRDDQSRKCIIRSVLDSGQGKERKHMALPGSLEYEDPLLYLGDKCGWDAVMLLKHGKVDVDVFDRFSNHMAMSVKIIHSFRDPRENISSWIDSPKYKREWSELGPRRQFCIRRYARFYGNANRLLEVNPHFDLANEDLCLHTEDTLKALCEYLELPIVEPWFSNAVNSVFKTPRKKSIIGMWDEEWWEHVGWRIIDKYEFFERYKE